MTDYALAVLAYFMLMVGAAIIGMWLQKKIDRLSSLEEHHRSNNQKTSARMLRQSRLEKR